MKLIEMRATLDRQGYIVLPKEPLGNAGLKPCDEVRITLVAGQEETESLCPQLVVTPQGVEVAVRLSGRREDDVEDDLTLPNDLLEAAEIPVGSDLELVCTAGAIVIMESDVLDSLPDELRAASGMDYGDIVRLTIHQGVVTAKKVDLIEVGDQSPETVEAFVHAAIREMPEDTQITLAARLLELIEQRKGRRHE